MGVPPAVKVANEKQSSRVQKVEIDDAIIYITKVKHRFSSEPQRYQIFLDILRSYQNNRGNMKDVFQQLSILFDGYDDLLDEFSSFLIAGTSASEAAGITSGNTPANRPRARKDRPNMATVKLPSVHDSSTSFGSSGGADSDEGAETNSLDSDESRELNDCQPLSCVGDTIVET